MGFGERRPLMVRSLRLLLLPGAALLSGCVAGMVASAAGMAVQSAQPRPRSNAELQPTARQACTAKASQYGTVHIIDVQQARVDKIIVWGTVDDGKGRQSFECSFGTQITGFKLRQIRVTNSTSTQS